MRHLHSLAARRIRITALALASSAILAACGPAWAQDIYYVATDGSHTHPYDTWAKAATNIQVAIDATAPGDTVLVSNGTYGIGAEISIAKAITVKSLNGPDATRVARTTGSARIFNLADASAIVAGFTATNGSPGGNLQGSGLYITAGTASNMIVTGCSGNRGSAVYMNGANAVLTHSAIRKNQDTGNSGGCGGVRMLGGAQMRFCTIGENLPGSEQSGVSAIYMQGNATVENCIIVSNRSYSAYHPALAVRMQANDTIRNCLIVDNRGRGLHMTGGVAQNCTVSGNVIYGGGGNGLFISAGQVQNSIVHGNGISPYTPWASEVSQSGGGISNSCSSVLLAGAGNIAALPLFRAPAAGDYTLLPGSPCIDSGTNLAAVTTDRSSG